MDNLNNNNEKLSKHEMELKNTLEGVKAFAKIKNIEKSDEEKTITGARGRIEKVAEIKKSKDPAENQKKRYNAAVKLQYNKKRKEWNIKIVGRKEVLEKQLALLKELEEKENLPAEEKNNVTELRKLIEEEVQKRNEKAAKKAAELEQKNKEDEPKVVNKNEIPEKKDEKTTNPEERTVMGKRVISTVNLIKEKREMEEKKYWTDLKEELRAISKVEGLPEKDRQDLIFLAWDIEASLSNNDLENLRNVYKNKTAIDLLPEEYRKMMDEDFIRPEGSKVYSAKEIAELYVEREKEANSIKSLPQFKNFKKDVRDYIEKDVISSEYRYYKKLMIKSYYGDKDYAKKYDEAIRRITSKENRVTVTRTCYDPETETNKEISYEVLKEYDKLEKDKKITQLEEYPVRLARYNAYKAGDKSQYPRTRAGDKLYAADKDYLETYNQKYNSRKTTYENLKTLGNYGKTVEYSKLKTGETFRNILRGTGNALIFIRNYTTAPINRFIGSKIVAPLYKRNAIKNDKWEYPNPFEDRPTHRYEKRKEYFRHKGNNFIMSRINAIINYKEGNEATLAARASELVEDISNREVNAARLEERKSSLGEYYRSLKQYKEEVTEKQENSKFKSNKERMAKNLFSVAQRNIEVKRDLEKLSKLPKGVDIIDFDAIDKGTRIARNNKDITRIITGVKIFAKAGVRFVGEKLSDWMIDNSTYEVPHEAVTEKIPGHYEIEEYEAWKYNGQDKDITNFLLQKEGQTVQVYGSTYPGAETVPYQISDRTIIRGIKTDIYGTDSSISDVAGNTYTEAYTPMVKNGFVEAIKQTTDKEGLNLTSDDIGKMITEGRQGDVYLAVSNRTTGIPVGWIKVSSEDLKEYFSDTLEETTLTRQGDWIPESIEVVQEAWTETVVNERVVSAINGSKKMMNVLSKIHDAFMVYENARDLEDKRTELIIEEENTKVRKLKSEYEMTEIAKKKIKGERYKYKEEDSLLNGHVEEKGFNYNPRTDKFEGSERD